jgi:uncharacterized protein
MKPGGTRPEMQDRRGLGSIIMPWLSRWLARAPRPRRHDEDGRRKQGARPRRNPAVMAAVGLIRTYQWTIRPFIGANCRFYPSCSEYAIEALRQHGAWRGSALAAKRILRCNPWHEGGYDPVPGHDHRMGH